ncbi:hypothetical protein TNCV_2912131 [Trichonephila clavipes]|nr:hypothetical protein TNCV_2912131 [Trichonephila clavipes]
MFSDGRQQTRNLPRPGQTHKVVKEKLIMHIDTEIERNRHRNIRDVTNESNVSIGSVLNWFHYQQSLFFADGIRNLPK